MSYSFEIVFLNVLQIAPCILWYKIAVWKLYKNSEYNLKVIYTRSIHVPTQVCLGNRNVVTFDFFSTGGKTHAKVGRLFCCSGYINTQFSLVKAVTLNSMSRVERVSRSNIPTFCSPNFSPSFSVNPFLPWVPAYCFCFFSCWTCMIYLPLDVKETTINQSMYYAKSCQK